MRELEGDLTCDGCGVKLEPGVYFTCDRDMEKEWCPACFDKTPCGKGEHEQDCATKIFSSQPVPGMKVREIGPDDDKTRPSSVS